MCVTADSYPSCSSTIDRPERLAYERVPIRLHHRFKGRQGPRFELLKPKVFENRAGEGFQYIFEDGLRDVPSRAHLYSVLQTESRAIRDMQGRFIRRTRSVYTSASERI